ncbi:MAG: TolC family protein [Magnetococcales bacterium]|nr:TolC family protein [Magnetococcales bacterium]
MVAAAPAVKEPSGHAVTMAEFVGMMVQSDELIRAQQLEERIAVQGVRGAEAIFEPVVTVSAEREGTHVLNSAADSLQRGLRAGDVYDAVESRAKVGLASKIPTGATAEVMYQVSEVRNSLQPLANSVSPEYKGYLGLNFSQPLMRGMGLDATRVGIDIATIEQDIAKQSVRQVMTQRLMEGLNSYIAVQRLQERVRMRIRLLDVTKGIEREMAALRAAGLQSAAELTKARSAVAMRKAQLSEAQEDLEEQLKLMQSFVSAANREKKGPVVASRLVPAEGLSAPSGSFAKAASDSDRAVDLAQVIERRPEARVNALRIDLGERKVAAALDQTLPDLSFNLRAGKDELSGRNKPLQYLSDEFDYHSWAVGVTFKMGLFGDEKKESEYEAERLRKEQAELTMGAVQQRIANEVSSSSNLFERAMQRVQRQQEMVTAQRDLLGVMRNLFTEGNRSGLDVLKQEVELLLVEESYVDAVAHAIRASYLVSQVDGSLLSRLGLE